MATFTITTSVNIDSLTSKSGADIYNINGGTLTIDQDSRVGLNQTTSATVDDIVLSSSLGGTLNIDGTDIWMIPYSSGSGNVPAWNTTITSGSGTGLLIAVHSSLTAASTATGAAMPATGFIRVKQKSGTYSSGALTGISANADDAGRVGWIEIVGNETGLLTANRLGTVNITGEWYVVGTTNGASNQTMQIPNNGLLRYVGGVYIEKSAGSGTYEFWPNAGTATTIGTESARGKVVWIDNTGLVRIGDHGAGTSGYTPVTGLSVVIGNIIFENATSGAPTANVIPNATIGNRYKFRTNGGGYLTMSKATFAWYGYFISAYHLAMDDCSFIDSIFFNNCPSAIAWNRVGVGNKPTTTLETTVITISGNTGGGTLTECVFSRANMTAYNSTNLLLSDSSDFNFIDCTFRSSGNRGDTANHAISCARATGAYFDTPIVVVGQIAITTSSDITVENLVFCDCVSSTTTTLASYCFAIQTGSFDILIDGLTMPVTNTHVYTTMIYMVASRGIRIRNIGTRSSPLSLGSSNACGYMYHSDSDCRDIKVQRVYCSNTRIQLSLNVNTVSGLIEENVFGDYADSSETIKAVNAFKRGIGATLDLSGQAGVYGTHWVDYFTSTTTGRIAIVMNEPTALTSSYVTLTNGSGFMSVGSIYMPTIGMTGLWETPEYILGHTGFVNTALVMGFATATDYRYEYAIDKNDGSGFSTLTSSSYTASGLGTALNGITGIDASLGFKLKLKITTNTTNTRQMLYVYLSTTSSTTAQDYQYPLETVTVRVTVKDAATSAVIQNARVRLIASGGGPASDGTVLLTGVTDSSGILQTTSFAYIGDQEFTGIVRKASASTLYKSAPTSGTITDAGSDITVFLISDE